MKEERHRIGFGTAAMMIAVALLYDLSEMALVLFYALPFIGAAIPILSDIIFTPVMAFTFWLWFKMHHVSLTDDYKKLIANVSTWIVELTPLGVLPLWTFTVARTIFLTWRADKKENEKIRKENAEFLTNQEATVQQQIELLHGGRGSAAPPPARDHTTIAPVGMDGVRGANDNVPGNAAPLSVRTFANLPGVAPATPLPRAASVGGAGSRSAPAARRGTMRTAQMLTQNTRGTAGRAPQALRELQNAPEVYDPVPPHAEYAEGISVLRTAARTKPQPLTYIYREQEAQPSWSRIDATGVTSEAPLFSQAQIEQVLQGAVGSDRTRVVQSVAKGTTMADADTSRSVAKKMMAAKRTIDRGRGATPPPIEWRVVDAEAEWQLGETGEITPVAPASLHETTAGKEAGAGGTFPAASSEAAGQRKEAEEITPVAPASPIEPAPRRRAGIVRTFPTISEIPSTYSGELRTVAQSWGGILGMEQARSAAHLEAVSNGPGSYRLSRIAELENTVRSLPEGSEKDAAMRELIREYGHAGMPLINDNGDAAPYRTAA